MKKKLVSTALAGLLAVPVCFALTACGGDQEAAPNQSTGDTHYKTLTYNYDGGSFDYVLYFPDAYSETGEALPLITYMPDGAYSGKKTTTLKFTECATGWITEEKMQKAPAVFLLLLPDQPENTYAVDLIDDICKDYNINTNKLYLTGQSAGGIMDWIINDKYTDKFAATVYCGCQPGNNVSGQEVTDLNGNVSIAVDEDYDRILENAYFVNQKFVYICSRKDGKAPFGQDDVTDILDEKGIAYGQNYELDCTNMASCNTAVKAELDKGYDHNFFGFTQVNDGTANMEHMMSFGYCYQVDEIYYWLLEQSL